MTRTDREGSARPRRSAWRPTALGVLLAVVPATIGGIAHAQEEFHDYHATWSPDGTRIAFMRLFSDEHIDIFVLEIATGSLTRLTDRSGKDHAPTWSPTGDRIAFCSDREGQDDIFVMAPDGTGVSNLTDHPAAECEGSWSPDGRRFAFTSDRNGNNDVFVVDLDGDDEGNDEGNGGGDAPAVQITTSTNYDLVVRGGWSPHGERIVYCSPGDRPFDGEEPDPYVAFAIYEIEPRVGATPRKIIDLPGEDSYPTFSPDGTSILFPHQEPLESRTTAYDIYEADADGSNPRPLIVGPGQQFGPAVSPDGRSIAFHSSASGRGAIWIADRDGSNARQLTNLAGEGRTR